MLCIAIMRIDTLLAFMMFSKRPICVAEDVIAHGTVKNNYAYIMNSEQKNAGDILACRSPSDDLKNRFDLTSM